MPNYSYHLFGLTRYVDVENRWLYSPHQRARHVSRCHAKTQTQTVPNRPNAAKIFIYDARTLRLAYVHFSLLHRAFSVFFRINFSPTCNSTIISLNFFFRFVSLLITRFLHARFSFEHFVHSWNITRNSHTLIYNEFRWTPHLSIVRKSGNKNVFFFCFFFIRVVMRNLWISLTHYKWQALLTTVVLL